MPLPSSLVGASTEAQVWEIDPRWTMAYAAALGDLAPCYMDTRNPVGFAAHPLFPVCFEWPVVVAMAQRLHGTELTAAEARRAVHATHDLVIHRPLHPPQKLSTRATVIGVERRKPGAFQLTRLDTVDESGDRVCTSIYGTIYRGVDVSGADHHTQSTPGIPRPQSSPARPRSQARIHVGGGLAHIYTECARIHNPIHTDIKVATEAGLPALILHGTATLALAVSRVVQSEAGGNPRRVVRIAGRFNAMVLMPSDIDVRILTRETVAGVDTVHFDVFNDKGEPAIANGAIILRA
jgi:acyl dehydratase